MALNRNPQHSPKNIADTKTVKKVTINPPTPQSRDLSKEVGMEHAWEHLKLIVRSVSSDYTGAVFIGGIAVATHASRLGPEFVEASHDADLYLSLQDKAAMRDRYEVWRNPNLNKDSAIIDGEEFDLYVDHQHSLDIPYAAIYAHSEDVEGIRVAALEHLLVLKCAAARSRIGTGKGDKDVRDLARIVVLLVKPRTVLLEPYLNDEHRGTLERALDRPDLVKLLNLNPHEGSKFRNQIKINLKAILSTKEIGGAS